MTQRILTLAGFSIGAGLMLFSIPQAATAQQPAPKSAATPYKQPMTSWGEPDISGMWPINHLVTTGLQRNARYGDRLYLTDEEFKAAQASAESRNKRFESGAIPAADSGEATRLTSLIVDPPNGRFPALTPKGKELYDKMHGSYKPGQTVFDTPEDFDSWDRCITRGMFPYVPRAGIANASLLRNSTQGTTLTQAFPLLGEYTSGDT